MEVNPSDLALLHHQSQPGKPVQWWATNNYSVSFINVAPDGEITTESVDDLKNAGHILEYVGISLRLMRRGWLRYHAN